MKLYFVAAVVLGCLATCQAGSFDWLCAPANVCAVFIVDFVQGSNVTNSISCWLYKGLTLMDSMGCEEGFSDYMPNPCNESNDNTTIASDGAQAKSRGHAGHHQSKSAQHHHQSKSAQLHHQSSKSRSSHQKKARNQHEKKAKHQSKSVNHHASKAKNAQHQSDHQEKTKNHAHS